MKTTTVTVTKKTTNCEQIRFRRTENSVSNFRFDTGVDPLCRMRTDTSGCHPFDHDAWRKILAWWFPLPIGTIREVAIRPGSIFLWKEDKESVLKCVQAGI